MPLESSIFISYSRKDYYFAESLAFHLLRRDVPAWMDVKDLKPGNDWEHDLEGALDAASTLLLVVSPDSMSSERVRSEWQRALHRGCRIVLIRFRGATLPPELQQCEVVDFRRSFGRALNRLITRFNNDTAGATLLADTQIGIPWTPALPPWIAVMTIALAVPMLAYFLLANWEFEPGSSGSYLLQAGALIAALGVAWFFCVAFLRRRMGMTRLAICLLALAFVIALPIVKYLLGGTSSLTTYAGTIGATVEQHWRQGVFLCAVPLAGLGVLLLLRPEDLLRWTPTGKAWATYRIGHVANAVFGRAELAFQFEQIKAFTLAHDPMDTPMAHRLRTQLVALGGSEMPAGDEHVTSVLLLTDRTQLGWIDEQTGQLRGAGVTVVGTGIGLPSNLDWLWRRQWIDFRGWDMRRSERSLALPQVPDAVTQPRLPAIVSRVHHVLCAVAGLTFVLAKPLMPSDEEWAAGPAVDQLLFCATAVVAIWWGLIAHRLLKRTRSAARFLRDFRIACIATAVVLCVGAYPLAQGALGITRVLLAVALLAGACVWLSRQQDVVAFWFPQDNVTGPAGKSALGRRRSWRTAIWIFLYIMLWMWMLGLAD